MNRKKSALDSSHVMEKGVFFIAPDQKRIYATIGYPPNTPKGIVIFVHGLDSSELWPPMLLGSWYFRRKGYAYCRVNLYDWRKGARTLMTSDLQQHARDVDLVVRRLANRGFGPIYAVGHSFGGLTLLQTQTEVFRALSLWDCSSFIEHPPGSWIRQDPASGARYLVGGCELLLSERFELGMRNFPNELSLISKITSPCQICYADGKNALLVRSSQRYYEHLTSPKELVSIPNATHSFSEEGVSDLLFSRTERWFRKHSCMSQ